MGMHKNKSSERRESIVNHCKQNDQNEQQQTAAAKQLVCLSLTSDFRSSNQIVRTPIILFLKQKKSKTLLFPTAKGL